MLINKELVFKGFEQPTAYWIADVGQNDRPTLRAGGEPFPRSKGFTWQTAPA